MKTSEIISLLQAKPINVIDEMLFDHNYDYVFATDLMSDALAMIQQDNEQTVLLTGLCNDQALRTAEMLDVELIIFVRGKVLDSSAIKAALHVNCFTTQYTMFEACGILYQHGLKGPRANV